MRGVHLAGVPPSPTWSLPGPPELTFSPGLSLAPRPAPLSLPASESLWVSVGASLPVGPAACPAPRFLISPPDTARCPWGSPSLSIAPFTEQTKVVREGDTSFDSVLAPRGAPPLRPLAGSPPPSCRGLACRVWGGLGAQAPRGPRAGAGEGPCPGAGGHHLPRTSPDRGTLASSAGSVRASASGTIRSSTGPGSRGQPTLSKIFFSWSQGGEHLQGRRRVAGPRGLGCGRRCPPGLFLPAAPVSPSSARAAVRGCPEVVGAGVGGGCPGD